MQDAVQSGDCDLGLQAMFKLSFDFEETHDETGRWAVDRRRQSNSKAEPGSGGQNSTMSSRLTLPEVV